jgi:hypothetical protein
VTTKVIATAGEMAVRFNRMSPPAASTTFNEKLELNDTAFPKASLAPRTIDTEASPGGF